MQSGQRGDWPEVTQEAGGRQKRGPALFTASWVLLLLCYDLKTEHRNKVYLTAGHGSCSASPIHLCSSFISKDRKEQ